MKSNLVNWLILLALTAFFIYGISSCRERNQSRLQVSVGTNSAEAVQTAQAEPSAPVALESSNVATVATNRVTVEFNFEPEIK